ncbi:MAG: hypothetical protein Wins2KO_04240 [Winogradskyella sp.]
MELVTKINFTLNKNIKSMINEQKIRIQQSTNTELKIIKHNQNLKNASSTIKYLIDFYNKHHLTPSQNYLRITKSNPRNLNLDL